MPNMQWWHNWIKMGEGCHIANFKAFLVWKVINRTMHFNEKK